MIPKLLKRPMQRIKLRSAQLEQEQQDTEMVDAEDTNGDDQPVISRRRRRSTRSEANGNGTGRRRGKVIAPLKMTTRNHRFRSPAAKSAKRSTAASVETIAEIQRRVAERAKEIEELEEDMRYQVKLSRVLSWENGSAKEKLGNIPLRITEETDVGTRRRK